MVTSGIERTVRATATYGVLCALAAFCIFPFLWMIDTALKPPDEVRNANPTFWIAKPTLENFRHVVNDGNFLVYFRNSMIVAGGSTLLALTVSIFCGYALSRFHREPLSHRRHSSAFVPDDSGRPAPHTTLYSHAPTWTSLDIRGADRRLLHVCNSSLLLHAEKLFDSVPTEIEDAAEMDGCSRLWFIFRILLPLSAPGILATGLFCFVTAWNEFLFGYVLINDDARRTLTPAIMVFKGPHVTDWGALMAASVLAVVPVALFFVYLQRFLIEGLSTGAVKG